MAPPPAGNDDVEALGTLLSMIQANDTVNSTTAGAQARSQESLAGSNARAGMASPPSKETLERLAARLKELVGEDVELPGQEMVNEEGMPIVDIREPITCSAADRCSPDTFTEAPPLRPPPRTEEERRARRKERDAFLDTLEQEEKEQEEREREADNKHEKGDETEFMKAVRIARERTREIRTGMNTQANAASSSRDLEDEGSKVEEGNKVMATKDGKAKKSVSFAGIGGEDSLGDGVAPAKTGDVQMAKLRKSTPGPKSAGSVMKMEIVERMPPAISPKAVTISTKEQDSDDDDDDGSGDSEDVMESDISHESGQILDEGDEGEIFMDDAMQQREIALRYHELRQSLGTGPEGGALGGFVDARRRDKWDQENVPLEANLAEERGFESDRLRFAAPRLDGSALDAALPHGLAGEVREGIPGDDGEPDPDIGERGRRIIEGLKKGLTVEEIMANEPVTEEELEHRRQHHASIVKRGEVLGEVKEKKVGDVATKPVIRSSIKGGKVSKFKANRLAQ